MLFFLLIWDKSNFSFYKRSSFNEQTHTHTLFQHEWKNDHKTLKPLLRLARMLNMNKIFVFAYEVNNVLVTVLHRHEHTTQYTSTCIRTIFIRFPTSHHFNANSQTKGFSPFHFTSIVLTFLLVNGLQLVSYDPFHGVLTIERKTEFCFTLRCHHILWFYFSGWKYIAFDFKHEYKNLFVIRQISKKRKHFYRLPSLWQK